MTFHEKIRKLADLLDVLRDKNYDDEADDIAFIIEEYQKGRLLPPTKGPSVTQPPLGKKIRRNITPVRPFREELIR